MSYINGQTWDQALTNGFIAAIACYFIGWACMLWVAGSVHSANYARAQRDLRAQHEARDRRMSEIVRKRLEAMGAEFDDSVGTMTLNGETLEAPVPPPQSIGRQDSMPGMGREAA
jgi:hypothetical protein